MDRLLLNLFAEIKELQEKLDEHSKKYQKFIDDLKACEENKINLLGFIDKDVMGKAQYLNYTNFLQTKSFHLSYNKQ